MTGLPLESRVEVGKREGRGGVTSRQANGLSNTESCGEGNGNGDGGSLGIPAW